jgi:protein-L-isoaspartate O-methyltransferase
LGGIFVSLVAPQIFTTFYEWPLGLAGCFLLAMGYTVLVVRRRRQSNGGGNFATQAALIATAICGAYLVHDWQCSGGNDRYNARNFYGTVSVRDVDADDPEQHQLQFRSGSIIHGKQYANPAKRRLPTAYYGGESGCARALEYVAKRPDAKIAVVGLGVGTIATYLQPGQSIRFYEINPAVEQIARQQFTYLSDCQGACKVVLGDARLNLEREAPNDFDVLVLDAFSGDSIPTHLLTDEAFQIYKKHLKPEGLLVLHITNSYLRLYPVAEKLARHHGFAYTRIYCEADSSRLLNRNDYLVLTHDRDFLAANPSIPPREPEPHLDVPLWTDQYSNLFMLLK